MPTTVFKSQYFPYIAASPKISQVISIYQYQPVMYKTEASKCFSCCVIHIDNCVASGGEITEHDQNLRFASSH